MVDFNDLKMSFTAADAAIVVNRAVAEQEAEAAAKREEARRKQELAEKERYELIKNELETISTIAASEAAKNNRSFYHSVETIDEEAVDIIADILRKSGYEVQEIIDYDECDGSFYNLEIRFLG